MEKEKKENRASRYMNPYMAGVFLGLVLLTAFYISGRGLGASGAFKSTVVSLVQKIAPGHAEHAAYYREYLEIHPGNPLHSWLIFQILGVIVGGFLSGAFAGRLTWKTEHSPKITSRKRLIMALLGGTLFGLGAQFGRGCTSGSALCGMAVLSLGGILSMVAIFGTGFILARFFRKYWI
jgi:uncharacterized membrane protein YedE/YeeE